MDASSEPSDYLLGVLSSLPPQMTFPLADTPLSTSAVQGKPGRLLQALNASAEVRYTENKYSDLPNVSTLIISYLFSQC